VNLKCIIFKINFSSKCFIYVLSISVHFIQILCLVACIIFLSSVKIIVVFPRKRYISLKITENIRLSLIFSNLHEFIEIRLKLSRT
jgi:hypothetical protein